MARAARVFFPACGNGLNLWLTAQSSSAWSRPRTRCACWRRRHASLPKAPGRYRWPRLSLVRPARDRLLQSFPGATSTWPSFSISCLPPHIEDHGDGLFGGPRLWDEVVLRRRDERLGGLGKTAPYARAARAEWLNFCWCAQETGNRGRPTCRGNADKQPEA